MMAYRFTGEASSFTGEYSLEEVVHECRVRSGLASATTATTATSTVRPGAWSSGRSCRGRKRTDTFGH
jgi:hypothetical protein